MKIVTEEVLIGGNFLDWHSEVTGAYLEIKNAIANVVWPAGGRQFTINPVSMGNGVKPIKNGFLNILEKSNWVPEVRATLSGELGPGKIDAIKRLQSGKIIAVEWETGNISSSHRALNKLAIGMLNKRVEAGFLVLPERTLYRYLTDRIGNLQELRPYFDVWRTMRVEGVLGIIGIEHDATSPDVPTIPKGLDGLSLSRRAIL
ncbi:MAG TPA: hypothetical protein PLN52_23785 [Opitutaceae bacterium]|nr:hypothetical protein [Opitutaceae bacterium]